MARFYSADPALKRSSPLDKSADRRAARKMIEAHGENAARKADERAKRLRESGEMPGANTWAHIAEMIRALQGRA